MAEQSSVSALQREHVVGQEARAPATQLERERRLAGSRGSGEDERAALANDGARMQHLEAANQRGERQHLGDQQSLPDLGRPPTGHRHDASSVAGEDVAAIGGPRDQVPGAAIELDTEADAAVGLELVADRARRRAASHRRPDRRRRAASARARSQPPRTRSATEGSLAACSRGRRRSPAAAARQRRDAASLCRSAALGMRLQLGEPAERAVAGREHRLARRTRPTRARGSRAPVRVPITSFAAIAAPGEQLREHERAHQAARVAGQQRKLARPLVRAAGPRARESPALGRRVAPAMSARAARTGRSRSAHGAGAAQARSTRSRSRRRAAALDARQPAPDRRRRRGAPAAQPAEASSSSIRSRSSSSVHSSRMSRSTLGRRGARSRGDAARRVATHGPARARRACARPSR